MNTQLINSLVQVIHSLSPQEQAALEEQLFFDCDYPPTADIMTLALRDSSFDFLGQDPDLYGITRPWLRWYDADGKWISTEAEKAERFAQRLRELGVDPDQL
ncbi:MAG: hypothetical protein ACFCU8_14125 [Thermosynechococcaceae cyanobacterium]